MLGSIPDGIVVLTQPRAYVICCPDHMSPTHVRKRKFLAIFQNLARNMLKFVLGIHNVLFPEQNFLIFSGDFK